MSRYTFAFLVPSIEMDLISILVDDVRNVNRLQESLLLQLVLLPQCVQEVNFKDYDYRAQWLLVLQCTYLQLRWLPPTTTPPRLQFVAVAWDRAPPPSGLLHRPTCWSPHRPMTGPWIFCSTQQLRQRYKDGCPLTTLEFRKDLQGWLDNSHGRGTQNAGNINYPIVRGCLVFCLGFLWLLHLHSRRWVLPSFSSWRLWVVGAGPLLCRFWHHFSSGWRRADTPFSCHPTVSQVSSSSLSTGPEGGMSYENTSSTVRT
jgi:hypothetical protein